MKNNEQEVGNQFLWLLENRKDEVVNALESANIDIDEDISPSKLMSVIRVLHRKIVDIDDKNSKNAILNISQLIAEKDSMFSGFYSNAIASRPDIDNIRDEIVEDSGKSRGGRKINYEKVAEVGNVLIGWLGKFGDRNNNNDNNTNSPNNGNSLPPTPPTRGISTGKIIAFSVLGLVLIGATVFAVKTFKK